MNLIRILIHIFVTSKCYGLLYFRLKQGEEVVPHSRPYQLVVTRPQLFCSGVLISPQYVLTAAHCLTRTKEIRVVFGVHNYEVPGPNQFSYTCKNFTIHKDFSYEKKRVDNDIAIIKLPQPVPLSPFVQPIKLAPANSNSTENSYNGQTGILTGWGLTLDSLSDFFILRKHTVPVMANEKCQRYVVQPILNTQMCTDGSLIVGACSRDSGAPLVIDNVLVGIVSYSNLICDSGWPTIYTRISSYRKWIANHTDVPENE